MSMIVISGMGKNGDDGGGVPPGGGGFVNPGGGIVGGALTQTPPPPAYSRRGLRDIERGAGSCGIFDCWLYLPLGAGAGLLLGLVAVAVTRAVMRRRGGS